MPGERMWRANCVVVLLLAAALLAGCGKSPSSGDKPAPTTPVANSAAAELPTPSRPARGNKPPADWTANEILAQLLTTYREARTYQDSAVVRLEFRQNGQPVAQEWPAAVALERPNKLSIVAYQATVKCNGEQFLAKIDDPASNNVDRQVVVRPAPQELKLVDLASDALLHDILSSRLRRQPIQLELLLESSGLISAFKADVVCERLADERQGARACFRVAVPSPGGAFTFWVDQEDLLLRRLDYPAAALAPELAGDPAVSELAILADLRNAKIDAPLAASEFALTVLPDARRMKSFVVPPRPLPSNLMGQQPADFAFQSLNNERVTSQDLRGSIAVLAWYHDNPACEATLQQVAAARQRLKDDTAVRFLAVATDPTTSSDEAVRQRLASWQADLPIVRDLEAFGDKAFHIDVQPTIVVLDARGIVQIFQAGGSPELADQLVAIVERLKRGDDLAAEVISRHEREQREYDSLLARGGPEPGEVMELPEAVIRRKSEPKKFRVERLWSCGDVQAPGNVLLSEGPGRESRILVVEGWRTVVELDAAGKVVGRHALDLPPQAAITFLRTMTDSGGKRLLLAAAPLAPQFFLFDEQYQPLLAYPPPSQSRLQIVDAALTHLQEPGGLEAVLVANVGEVGLVAVSAAGELLWRNNTFPSALSSAVVKQDIGGAAIYVAGETGNVLRVNRFGKDEPPLTVANWPIARLFAADSSAAGNARLLGLSNNAKGEPFAVGLNDALKEQWNYPLPLGVHQKPIEAVTSSQMLPGYMGEWWVAGPDGSIHLITADGRLFDSFFVGAALSGLAAGKVGDQPTLVISTPDSVSAYRVELPARTASREF